MRQQSNTIKLLKRYKRRAVNARGVLKTKQAHERGDLKKFIHELTFIASKGTLEQNKVMWAYFKDVVHSEFLKSKSGKDTYSTGMRWSASTKDFMTSQKLQGGKKIPRGLRANIGGPHISTIAKHLQKILVTVQPGMKSYANFVEMAKQWAPRIKERHQSHPHEVGQVIPCEMSEDESGMIPRLSYWPEKDSVWGSCGWRDRDHKCDPSFAPVR